MNYQNRFKFIRHALEESGGFDSTDASSNSYLIRYPRESQDKYERRKEVAWYVNDLLPACSRFAGHLALSPPDRDFPTSAYEAMSKDVDGQGSPVDEFFKEFAKQAKAFGSMLLLVDGPTEAATNEDDRVRRKLFPRFRAISPDRVTEYELGDDGKFTFVTFSGRCMHDGKMVDCEWTFTRTGWKAVGVNGGGLLASGSHSLGECPVLVFTESGPFPCFGPFSQIAALSRRLYNLHSELDEILRSQTFSLLTYQVPPDQAHAFKESAGKIAETIGTHNMLMHNGEQPGFIAPPEGPAMIYLQRIEKLERKISEIAMNVEMPQGQESGITMKYRYQALNAALADFAGRLGDLERRAWDLAARWFRQTAKPEAGYKQNYMLADIMEEMSILQQMQAGAMPRLVVAEQMKRIVSIQFGGLDQDRLDEITAEIDEYELEVDPDPEDKAADEGDEE
jgi:hypothetical protein